MALSETIYRLRTEHGLSQGDLAAELDVSRQSISKWETGSSVPELDKLVAMSRLFGVTLDELVLGGAQTDGAEGVKAYVDKLKAELSDTMAMCGAHSIADIDRSMLYGF